MDNLALDACFLIAFKESRRLDILCRVARFRDDRRLIISNAAYMESTRKDVAGSIFSIETMINDGDLQLFSVDTKKTLVLQARFPFLGDGELESFVLIQDLCGKGEVCYFVSDDQKAIRVAKSLLISTLSTLDFVKIAHKDGNMTNREVREIVPLLARHMWVDLKIIRSFINSFASEQRSES